MRNLERSRWFYHEVLGLKIVRESKTLDHLGGFISLISREHGSEFDSFYKEGFQTRSIVCIESSNIQVCHDQVKSFIEVEASPIQERSSRKVFRCVDLDGNVIEIFEAIADKTSELNPHP